MSKKLMPKLAKLEASPIWKEANRIAERIYKITADYPDEEKWQSRHKLRQSASDLIFYVALGLGNGAPGGQEFDWGYARKSITALKTIYRFAGRQGFLEIDPAIMVDLDRLVEAVDTELAEAYERVDQLEQNTLKPWLKKYRIWQEISKEPKL